MGKRNSVEPRLEVVVHDASGTDDEGEEGDDAGLGAPVRGLGENEEDAVARDEPVVITEAKSKKKITITLKNKHEVVCVVCGQTGHTAGFVGATYVDCPVKPCYLCKQPGHTTASCPYRLDPTFNIKPPAGSSSNVCAALRSREPTWKIQAACLKINKKRVTALDFPPGSLNLVCSCDKHGLISVWDFCKVSERVTYDGVHGYQVQAMRFLPGRDGMSLLSASCDGTVSVLDIETGMHQAVCNRNPGGWVEGVTNERNWNMMQAVAVHAAHPDVALTGDSHGLVIGLDLRAKDVAWERRAHASTSKLLSMELHPLEPNLLLTAANDKLVKLFDVRMLREPLGDKKMCEDLVSIEHPRFCSNATFSPATGRTLMTTCADNRIRVWDDAARLDKPASRELVHSHDFSRYLTPFRAQWDPKDTSERTVVIGRYISEDHDGLVLHPIDILDAGSGALLNSLVDPNLQLINPVNLPHPLLDVIITGSSGHLYCWRPEEEEQEDDGGFGAVAQADEDAGEPGTSGSKAGLQQSRYYTSFEVQSADGKASKKRKNGASDAKQTGGHKAEKRHAKDKSKEG